MPLLLFHEYALDLSVPYQRNLDDVEGNLSFAVNWVFCVTPLPTLGMAVFAVGHPLHDAFRLVVVVVVAGAGAGAVVFALLGVPVGLPTLVGNEQNLPPICTRWRGSD